MTVYDDKGGFLRMANGVSSKMAGVLLTIRALAERELLGLSSL